MTGCSGTGAENVCPTREQVFAAFRALLPRGRAWQSDEHTIDRSQSLLQLFWWAVAGPWQALEQRICDALEEFSCATMSETVEAWRADYGLPDECDPYADNLCLKVARDAGTRCEYLIDVARRRGWVITCTEVWAPVPMTGCWELGCAPLPPPQPLDRPWSNVGEGALSPCDFGRAVDHPNPDLWEASADRSKALCPVPGSELGVAIVGPDCCMMCGWYEMPAESGADLTSACADGPPAACGAVDMAPVLLPGLRTDKLVDGGIVTHAHRLRVTIDLPASLALQGLDPATYPLPAVTGCWELGIDPLCPVDWSLVICEVERVKPAHVVIDYEVQR